MIRFLPALPLFAPVLLACAPPAAAQAAWWHNAEMVIDRDDTGCTVHPPLGPADRTRMALRIFRDRSRVLILSGQRWRFDEGQSYHLRLTPIAEGHDPIPPIELAGTGFRGEQNWAGVRVTVTSEQEAALLLPRLLRVEDVTGRRRRAGDVATVSGGTLPALTRCVSELEAAAPGSGLPPVAPPMLRGRFESLMALDDYPAAAIRAEQQGRVTMRLTISAKGRISNCQIIRSSGSDVLDETSCRLLSRRARFSPAVDANGDATESSYEQGIDWSLPPGWLR